MFVPFSSLLPLINRLDTARFSDLLASYCFAHHFFSKPTFISFASNICLVPLIGLRLPCIYFFYFVCFLIHLFLQTRLFKQPATLAAFLTWVLIGRKCITSNLEPLLCWWSSFMHLICIYNETKNALLSKHVEKKILNRLYPWVAATLPSGVSTDGDREMLTRYGGYQGNKIPGADLSSICCLAGKP